jgi:hypothetical protein
MKAEMGKRNPDLAAIDDRMNRTVDRRKEIIEASTVDTVLDTFPALRLENQVGIKK